MLHTVTVQFGADQLGALMADMRTWLDDLGIEPDTFRYRLGAEPAVIHVEFKIEAEARAFAKVFKGELAYAGCPPGDESLGSAIAA